MFTIGPLGFLTPWLLWGLVALPILWFLLRAVPPAPIRRRFPGVALLLGLKDEDAETDRTPWWLLLLRMAAIAALILGFAGPVLNPEPKQAGSGPLLIALDAGWADTRDWPRRLERAGQLLDEAGRDGRPVAVIRLTDAPDALQFQVADQWAGRLAAMQPAAWSPSNLADWAAALPEEGFDTVWLSDGLDHPGRDALTAAFAAKGALSVVESPRVILGLHPASFVEGKVRVAASRLPAEGALEIEVIGRGPDPAGIDRELARATLRFDGNAARSEAEMELPPELRNRVKRFEIAGMRASGAVSLTDDSLKRRKVALIAAGPAQEGLQLLSPTHYLHQALVPVADLLEGALTDVIPAAPDVIILADVARLTDTEQQDLVEWVEKGGLLLRFAGPRLAASELSRYDEDPLLPVRLREGGRSVGGAMSWGDAKGLAPFAETSPFFGLAIPEEVTVGEQVLAQPDPDLSERTIAQLADGTPLVTRKTLGEGQVVLFHVTANAEWSNLPLSGLFVAMLERLAVMTRPATPDAADLAGQVWVPETVLDAWGVAHEAGDLPGVSGEVLGRAITETGPGPDQPPGLYAGQDRQVALNVLGPETTLSPASWPAGVPVEGLATSAERSLKGEMLGGGLLLLFADILAALALGGRLGRLGRSAAVLALALVILPLAPRVEAQEAPPASTTPVAPEGPQPGDDFAIEATAYVVLGYVKTGDTRQDEITEAGLFGLGDQLFLRTAVEPGKPIGVDLEKDELAFFPFLYWAVTPDMPTPSAAAYAKLNQFLRTGGMILFDTRDAEVAAYGGQTPEGAALQRIAAGLDIPPLEPVPSDHVLTRTFYLLQDFPGRQNAAVPWVEASPADATQEEGVPFRNLNDGVTPVVIGGNDWASAWAVDQDGVPILPIGNGAAGERQREMSYRFGINLIMHVLTGNYKSDQVHVPALLDRLGQ